MVKGPTRRADRSEHGAATIMLAMLTVVILGFAALGVDIAQQVSRKHLLINQLDAAATAGAYQLGDGADLATAVASAAALFEQNGGSELDLGDVDFWCVVARQANPDRTPVVPARVADLQIPSATRGGGTCNPDAASNSTTWEESEYQDRVRPWDGKRLSMTCNETLCAVPCAMMAGPGNGWDAGTSVFNNRPIRCNTMRIAAEEDVPFSFAPVLGIDDGSTGAQVSVACAGSCGEVAPNPMDVVVVADRTLSMAGRRADLRDGITSMLQVMTPEQQYVSLGALGPSIRTRANSLGRSCNWWSQGLVYPSEDPSTASQGSWVPIPFFDDYLGEGADDGTRELDSTSPLVQAINCLPSTDGDSRLGRTGTALASPLKAAARYVLGMTPDGNNIAALGGDDRNGEVRKVIIFETDGEPQEPAATTTGSVSLDDEADVFSNYTDYSETTGSTPPVLGSARNGTPREVWPRPPYPYDRWDYYPDSYDYRDCNWRSCDRHTRSIDYEYRTSTELVTTGRSYHGGQQACQNFLRVAELAKERGILVITIGYGLGGSMCSGNNSYSGSRTDTDADTGEPWISNIQPSACRRGGNGTQANPYRKDEDCHQDMTITYTVPQRTETVQTVQRGDDQLVTNVLAAASGGDDFPVADASGCTTEEDIATENSDDDLFFCAARGDDMAPLFVTALSKVSKGVRLMRMP